MADLLAATLRKPPLDDDLAGTDEEDERVMRINYDEIAAYADGINSEILEQLVAMQRLLKESTARERTLERDLDATTRSLNERKESERNLKVALEAAQRAQRDAEARSSAADSEVGRLEGELEEVTRLTGLWTTCKHCGASMTLEDHRARSRTGSGAPLWNFQVDAPYEKVLTEEQVQMHALVGTTEKKQGAQWMGWI